MKPNPLTLIIALIVLVCLGVIIYLAVSTQPTVQPTTPLEIKTTPAVPPVSDVGIKG